MTPPAIAEALTFYVPGTPEILTRPRIVKRGPHHGLSDHPNTPKKRRIAILARVAKQGRPMFVGPLRVSLVAVWKAPRVADRGQPKSDGADIDNVIKLYLDALNGVAWADDAQVAEVHAIKRYTMQGEQPGVTVEIGPVP